MSSLQPPSPNSGMNPESELFSGKTRGSRGELKKLATWANDQMRQAKNSRWRHERQWYLNLAFYFGQQNVRFRNAANNNRDYQLVTPPAPYYRARPVFNKIRPIIRTEMSKLTSQKPSAFIVPSSSEDKDIFAAQAGEQIWESLYREKHFHKILRSAVFWNSICGNGFIKTYWDEYELDVLSNQMGDIKFCAETPFHLFVPDLKAEEIEDQPFVIHAQSRHVEKVAQKYGVNLHTDSEADIISDHFLTLMGLESRDKNKEVVLKEIWVKPGELKILPQGGIFTVANDKVVYGYEGWPYAHRKYPFAHIGHLPTGNFYRESVINDLVGPQKEFNRIHGQIIEAKNRMAKPQLAAEMGSIDASKITSEPGQIIFYRPGFQPPSPIPIQALPQYVLNELDRIESMMDDISGQHEISRGDTPPGVTAATAISYLQEQDETKLSSTFNSLEEAVEKVAKCALYYVHQYWDTDRTVRVTGVDGSFDAKTFKGSDLRGNTDIRVEGGSALPVSKAAKQAFIMDLMKMGFIEPKKGLEVMEMGGINKIYESIQEDARQAQRENLRMAKATIELIAQHESEQIQKLINRGEIQVVQDPNTQQFMQVIPMVDPNTQQPVMDQMGQPATQMVPFDPENVNVPLIVPVNTWDDHRIHIETHNKYRKSQSYDELEDVQKDLFEEHVKQHVAAIMTGVMSQIPQELLTPEMLETASNPEAYKEMDNMEQNQVNPDMPQPEGGQSGSAPS